MVEEEDRGGGGRGYFVMPTPMTNTLSFSLVDMFADFSTNNTTDDDADGWVDDSINVDAVECVSAAWMLCDALRVLRACCVDDAWCSALCVRAVCVRLVL